MDLSIECLKDLDASGLKPEDLNAKPLTEIELTATKLPATIDGYVIPYYNMQGIRLPFYRVKCFNNGNVKYKQASGTANHIYFPITFNSVIVEQLNSKTKSPFIIITEGEKKAAVACKLGFPTVAIGGVNSWKSRVITLPPNTTLSESGKSIKAKIPAGSEVYLSDLGKAVGLEALFNLCIDKNITLIILFDTDTSLGTRFEVQKAAALLGHEAHKNGCKIENIRQLYLPAIGDSTKVGLDDYLVKRGPKALKNLVDFTLSRRNAFPRMPNIKQFVNDKLRGGKIDREETQNVSLAILAELDARGRRITSAVDGAIYFFDEGHYTLIPATMLNKASEPLHESPFGTYLYKEFGLGAADNKILQWLATLFTGEGNIEKAYPKKVVSLLPDDDNYVAVQISDSHFAVVSGDIDSPLTIMTNGSRGILFEQGQVAETTEVELKDAFDELFQKPITNWWLEILEENFSFKGTGSAQKIYSLLCYLSPFLMRWKGSQLPIEILIGEPGSGKSSLYSLRLGILTGDPRLRNAPTDIKDWYASIASVGGLHVTDNVVFTSKELKQRISDEICRLITEATPKIEMRKLFTTSSQLQLSIDAVFAMTAINQPFHNADIIQRSAILEVSAIRSGHDSGWIQRQLDKKGGRTYWLAHHLLVLHKFLNYAQKHWDCKYPAGHRLANYEQNLTIMSKVLNTSDKVASENSSSWVKKSLALGTATNIMSSDWSFSGFRYIIATFLADPKKDEITVTIHEVVKLFQLSEDYFENPVLTSVRSLMRFIAANRSMLERILGFIDLDPNQQDPAKKQFKIRRIRVEE